MAGSAVLELAAGGELVLDGVEWTVERREPHLGRVHLVRRGAPAQSPVWLWAIYGGCER
jgi:hypothetical protein